MSRIQALLAAGALTGLVIMAFFWYGTSDAADPVTSALTPAANIMANITSPDESSASNMQLLQEQNQQLRETVTTLLNREEQYRRQIEEANQKLLAPQGQTAVVQSAIGRFFQDDDDRDDDRDEDHDDHERDTHEEHEYAEHDDDD